MIVDREDYLARVAASAMAHERGEAPPADPPLRQPSAHIEARVDGPTRALINLLDTLEALSPESIEALLIVAGRLARAEAQRR